MTATRLARCRAAPQNKPQTTRRLEQMGAVPRWRGCIASSPTSSSLYHTPGPALHLPPPLQKCCRAMRRCCWRVCGRLQCNVCCSEWQQSGLALPLPSLRLHRRAWRKAVLAPQWQSACASDRPSARRRSARCNHQTAAPESSNDMAPAMLWTRSRETLFQPFTLLSASCCRQAPPVPRHLANAFSCS